MKVMDESFDDELSKRLKQFSAEPKESLWDSIAARIETEDREVRLQKKIRIGWIFIFSSILIGGVFYFVGLDFERTSSIATTGKKKELTNDTPADAARKRDEVRAQLPSQKKSNAQKIEGLQPKHDKSSVESNTSINFEIEGSTTTNEWESNPADIPANQIEIASANHSRINEVALDSGNNLTAVKTKVVKKVEQQPMITTLKKNEIGLIFTSPSCLHLATNELNLILRIT